MDDGIIHVSSIVSYTTNEPIVTLKWGNENGQMTPKEARDHALILLRAADAAESDAFMLRFFKHELDCDESVQVGMLRKFRSYREAQEELIPEEG